MTLADA